MAVVVIRVFKCCVENIVSGFTFLSCRIRNWQNLCESIFRATVSRFFSSWLLARGTFSFVFTRGATGCYSSAYSLW